jgi:branched-chain amino acid aminotransferase
MIENEDVRTVRGGTGFAKCGGNYAASTRAGERAAKMGYSQVLWLDGVERKYIEEVGAMNVMFKIGGKIVTPMLTGSILPGITRMSCIEVLRSLGYTVEERLLSVDELIHALETGELEEAWGCGTAAVVSPIGKLAYGEKEYEIAGGKIGEVTQKLYDILTGIQWGKTEDVFSWVHKL